MFQLNILIVGASIAGPTAAYWFARGGAKVTVIERFPQLRTNGQNVDIRTSGVAIMRKISGMEAAVRSKSTPMEGISFVRADGRPLATIKPTGNPDQQALVSEYEIFRGDLARILFDLTKDNKNIRYVFNEQVVSMRQQNDDEDGPVTVEFANGFPTSEFDLVVACDGATSRTRAIGFQCGVRDYVESLKWWTAYFTIKQDILEGSPIGQSYSAPGGRFACAGPDPSGVNRVALMGIHPRNAAPNVMDSFREAQREGKEDGLRLKHFVAQHFRGVGWKCDEIISGMMDTDDFYATEMMIVKPPTFFNRRCALVGDAGYGGAPGSGTTLALTGAYLLAGEICKRKSDIASGLKAYEERMRPIVDDLQKIPPMFPTVLGPQTAWGLWLRNLLIVVISRAGILDLAQRWFGGNSAAEMEKYKVPDYDWEVKGK